LKLEDIAQLAGVSRSTVSRVVNNQPNVNQATRKKVLQIIEEQNFRPNVVARALVTRQTRTLSLVIPQHVTAVFGDPYFSTLLQGIVHEANLWDYAVMLWMGNSFEKEQSFCQRVLDNGFFDGVLITSAVDGDALIPRLIEAQFPFVLIGTPSDNDLNHVDVENVRASKGIVTHLINLGRKRIGTVTGPMDMIASRHRLLGYRQALEAAGLPYDESLVIEGNFDRQSGYAGGRHLLRQNVDAIFSADDVAARGVFKALDEAGKRIPEDISVVGFDDLPFAHEMTPPLTTVRQPIAQVGGSAIRMLINVIENPSSEPSREILSTELVVRKSCGAV
jgi:LacI family transcriptional regulator